MPAFDVKRWERQMELRRIERDERRKAAARERRRLLKANAAGAISQDERRQLFGSRFYPERID